MQEPTKEQMHDFLFMNLIMQYQQMAWIQLGKIKNPASDKLERDLQGAKFSIDLLEMIRDKTTGNLKNEEEQMLNHAISELQLNYVDEVNKEAKEKQAVEEKAEPQANEEQAASEEKAEPQANEEQAASEEKAEPQANEEQAASEEKVEPQAKQETPETEPETDSDKTKESE